MVEVPDGLESYVYNCLVNPKPDDGVLFYDCKCGAGVLAALDGYAVIPMDEYERLCAMEPRDAK